MRKGLINVFLLLFIIKNGIAQTNFKVIQPMLLLNTQYYKYKSSEYYVTLPNPTWVAEIGLVNGIKLVKGDTIRLIQRFTFTYEDIPYAIIKYSIAGRQNRLPIIDAKLLELNNKKWVFSMNNKFEDIVYAIKVIKPAYFSEFKYVTPRINEILFSKEIFSGEDRRTNLSKLGKYLKSNPKEMEPFCDF